MPSPDPSLSALLCRIRACRLCAAHLPLPPRPIVQAGERARILIAGQAPGLKVQQSGVPFDDASGERLRAWLGLDRDTFYDASRVAIAPMGFCYPGKRGSGDAPPRPECAPAWREALLAKLPEIRLTLVVGQYATRWHLGQTLTLTEAATRWREFAPSRFVLPHPSPRNRPWLAAHPWFEAEVIPALQAAVRAALA